MSTTTPSKLHYFFLILLLASIGQVMSNLYLPSLPDILIHLQSDKYLIQMSVSVFLIGFCISKLFYGPVSDAFGRKLPLYQGLTVTILGTLTCLFSTNATIFLSGRLLQGLGCGAGGAVARAMVRDVYHENELAKYNSYFSIGGITVSMSAPYLGGLIQQYFGWRYNFISLLIYALFVLMMVFFSTETNRYQDKSHIQFSYLSKNVKLLLTNKHFLVYALSIAMTYGGMVAWMTSGPFLVQDVLGYGPVIFGQLAFALGCCYALGALINSKLNHFIPLNNLIKTGFFLMTLGSSSLMLSIFGHFSLMILGVSVAVYMFGASFVFPNAFASGLIPFYKIAGLSGALLGASQMLGGATFSMIISWSNDINQIPLACIMLTCSIIGLLASLLLLEK